MNFRQSLPLAIKKKLTSASVTNTSKYEENRRKKRLNMESVVVPTNSSPKIPLPEPKKSRNKKKPKVRTKNPRLDYSVNKVKSKSIDIQVIKHFEHEMRENFRFLQNISFEFPHFKLEVALGTNSYVNIHESKDKSFMKQYEIEGKYLSDAENGDFFRKKHKQDEEFVKSET